MHTRIEIACSWSTWVTNCRGRHNMHCISCVHCFFAAVNDKAARYLKNLQLPSSFRQTFFKYGVIIFHNLCPACVGHVRVNILWESAFCIWDDIEGPRLSWWEVSRFEGVGGREHLNLNVDDNFAKCQTATKVAAVSVLRSSCTQGKLCRMKTHNNETKNPKKRSIGTTKKVTLTTISTTMPRAASLFPGFLPHSEKILWLGTLTPWVVPACAWSEWCIWVHPPYETFPYTDKVDVTRRDWVETFKASKKDPEIGKYEWVLF